MFSRKIVLPAALIALSVALAGCGSGGPMAALSGQCPGIGKPVDSGPGFYDGDDGDTTTQKGPLKLDGSGCDGTIATTDDADNWTFEGKANQTIDIYVQARGETDPDLTVIDPHGDILDGNDDDGDSPSSRLNTTLPEDGVYTLRVDAFTEGAYTISVKSGTPEPDSQ